MDQEPQYMMDIQSREDCFPQTYLIPKYSLRETCSAQNWSRDKNREKASSDEAIPVSDDGNNRYDFRGGELNSANVGTYYGAGFTFANSLVTEHGHLNHIFELHYPELPSITGHWNW